MLRFAALILVLATCASATNAFGQLIAGQVRADYRQPTCYGPSDPNFRSRLFLEQTGHSGRYYNCDGEEDKRFSPYIYWTSVDNTEHVRTWWNVLKCDIREVRQRVQWGNCSGCESCQCSHCQQHAIRKAQIADETHASGSMQSVMKR
jgi:hypothetical protein